MAVVESLRDRDYRMRRSFWEDDHWLRDWDDWPNDWPSPRELFRRFRSDFDRRGFLDWPSDWPTMDTMVPRFSSHLDRMDRNWRSDPFWRDLYPRWAEPIFKEGIDIKSKIINDSGRFAVEVDAYQFKPEEIQVKTIDDTLLIEGRHEDVRDRDNFTKMYFVRKYQLPSDVNPVDITSSIDSSGRLTVEAMKPRIESSGRERVIPIEGPSRRAGRSHSNSPRGRTDSAERPQTRSQSSAYYQHTKTTGPVTTTDDRARYDRSSDYQARDERMDSYQKREERREREFHSESKNEFRSESRQEESQKYRVESPATTYSQQSGRQNGNHSAPSKATDIPKSESRSESVRSVQILRKSFQ